MVVVSTDAVIQCSSSHGELQEGFLSVLNSVIRSMNENLTGLLKKSSFRLNIKAAVLTPLLNL